MSGWARSRPRFSVAPDADAIHRVAQWSHEFGASPAVGDNGKRIFGYTLRTPRWRYNKWGAGEELYDHDSDPREFRNLARDSTCTDVLKEMRNRLQKAKAK